MSKFNRNQEKDGMFDNIKWVPVIIALVVGLLIPDKFNPLSKIVSMFGSDDNKKTPDPA